MATIVRPMTQYDVTKVVGVHLAAFPHFFLSFLGREFLQELYLSIVEDCSGIASVLEVDGQIGGFVAGTDNPEGFYMRLLRQRWWRFAYASAAKALYHPHIIPRLLRALSTSYARSREPGCALLMSIGVRPDIQGKHYGHLLVNTFLSAAYHRGSNIVVLTTDQCNNEQVNAFYRHLGFELVGHYATPEGRGMNEYRMVLNNINP